MRLIDADALKKQFEDRSLEDFTHLHFIDAIDNAPTVEITEEQAIDKLHETGWLPLHDKEMTERPHGEWIKHIDNLYPEDSTEECPFCHEEQRLVGNDDNFCPNCGADMRKEAENE